MSSCMSRCGQCLHAYHTVVNVSMHVTWCQMSPYISHSGKCLHACHMAVIVSMHVTCLPKNLMTQTFKTCVCSEANFQLANFHNINLQSGVEWSGELPICKLPKHKLLTCRVPTHDSQCLHAYHMVSNVSIYITWWSMAPCMSHGVKCLHACYIAVNVSMHVTWCQMSPHI